MPNEPQTILLAGASRGLGLGLAREYLHRGAHVIATARDPHSATQLSALTPSDRLRIEKLDVTSRHSIDHLAAALTGTTLDLLFIVAGQGAHMQTPIQDVPPDDAAREFLTNAHGPLVLAEQMLPHVRQGGTIALMTSVLGSIASSNGGMDLYRASKAALNMLAVGFARRHPGHEVLLIHPGWVRTDMGGAQAPLDVETSVRGMADTIARRAGRPGIAYLDYKGETIPW